MEKQKKNRGYRGKVGWGKSIRTIDSMGRSHSSEVPQTPKEWRDSGASKCTVRMQKSLRDLLIKQLAIENERRPQNKVKEVDAVNKGIFEWICRNRSEHIFAARTVKLVFQSGFDYNDALGVLVAYDLITIRNHQVNHKTPQYSVIVSFPDHLRRSSPRFKRDLLIVASYVTSCKVLEYRKQKE